jgi:putative membrane protein
MRPFVIGFLVAASVMLVLVVVSPTARASAEALCGLAPQEFWRSWNANPIFVAGLVMPAWLYARGTSRLWQRGVAGRGVQPWQLASFAAGMAILFIALISPLHGFSHSLFSLHMTQHLLLMVVAPPLLVLGSPLAVMLAGVPAAWQKPTSNGAANVFKALRPISRPGVAWVLHAGALWLWHMPFLYQAALTNELVHLLEHIMFIGTAVLFWWSVLHGRKSRVYGAGVFWIFTMALQSSILGALITFGSQPWYPAYQEGVVAWGLTLLEDQQLAGAVMWVPAGIIYLVAIVGLFAAWLQAIERDAEQRLREAQMTVEAAHARRRP